MLRKVGFSSQKLFCKMKAYMIPLVANDLTSAVVAHSGFQASYLVLVEVTQTRKEVVDLIRRRFPDVQTEDVLGLDAATLSSIFSSITTEDPDLRMDGKAKLVDAELPSSQTYYVVTWEDFIDHIK